MAMAILHDGKSSQTATAHGHVGKVNKMDKIAVQEYNMVVQVVAGRTIEYNTELRHRRGATTSMSVAFHLE